MKISKSIPIPSVRGRPSIYPFAEMEIGDSFFCPGHRARNAATAYGRRNGKKFTVRLEDEAGVYGLRVWRVA